MRVTQKRKKKANVKILLQKLKKVGRKLEVQKAVGVWRV